MINITNYIININIININIIGGHRTGKSLNSRENPTVNDLCFIYWQNPAEQSYHATINLMVKLSSLVQHISEHNILIISADMNTHTKTKIKYSAHTTRQTGMVHI